MHEPKNNPPTPKAPLRVTSGTQLDQQLAALRRRIIRQASKAVDLLRQSLEVLWDSDDERVQAIRAIEREIDIEEVKIEQECFQILALQQPFAADFRLIAFCLKVNTDIERLADHASSIAKISKKIMKDHPAWPESLREMGERIPVMCQELLRAVINADADAAREVSSRDKIIDKLDKRTFRELAAKIEQQPSEATSLMLMYRVSRELERVGDLLSNIGEDIIYLVTGEIVRHEGGSGKDKVKDKDKAKPTPNPTQP